MARTRKTSREALGEKIEKAEAENNGIDKNAPQLRLWCEF